LNVAVFVCPETTTAFNAWDAVIAKDDVPANCDDTDPVYELKSVMFNLPVPTASPLRFNEPVMFTEPVKS